MSTLKNHSIFFNYYLPYFIIVEKCFRVIMFSRWYDVKNVQYFKNNNTRTLFYKPIKVYIPSLYFCVAEIDSMYKSLQMEFSIKTEINSHQKLCIQIKYM